MLTKVTDEEKMARKKLFVVPEKEKEPSEIKKTQKYLKITYVLGIVVAVVLLALWGVPVLNNK